MKDASRTKWCQAKEEQNRTIFLIVFETQMSLCSRSECGAKRIKELMLTKCCVDAEDRQTVFEVAIWAEVGETVLGCWQVYFFKWLKQTTSYQL